MKPESPFPLLDLPRELRDEIYRNALPSTSLCPTQRGLLGPPKPSHLLLTNRQIYQEAKHV